ncbi:MAG: serine/threonine-protein kinase, partial [Acidobacteriota bacterium]
MPRGQDPEGFAELRAIFERAVDLEGEEQRRFLREACGDDSELRRAVEELIGADRRSGRFLDEPLELDDLSTMDGDAGTDPPSADGGDADGISGDSLIGPYRLLRRLGRGGMGEVFLAVRADDAFRRRVVVKLVRRDRDDEDILRRSRAERQILAGLDHPHIARLYDGGTTEDRRPYFVMEYIEGVEIDDFCDQNRLSIDERLTLLRKVCAAVHYAHQNLVVHRDLKPSNILVTSDGEPKLLDFGIAKLLNPELGGDDLQQTATWLRLMTPQYASPEQVRGKHVTVTSDVYSLGVLLYKLLSGRLPSSFGGCSPREIERLLTETEPPKPSAVVVSDPAPPRALETAIQDTAPALASAEVARFRGVGPKELRRLLKGDLDSITAKALRASPQRRYASAEQLAEDLRRFQEGRPVAARAGTLRYRAGKLLRRRRGTIAASALLVAMLGGTLWSQSEQAEALAAERDQKQMVLSLLIEALRVADPYVHAGGDQLTIAEALERSRELLHQRLLDQPVLRAEML